MEKNRRKELLEEYKKVKICMGVYKIQNTVNGKIFIGSFPNIKNRWLTAKMQLEAGRHYNTALQKEWKEFGSDAFAYEVLEEKECEEGMDLKWEVKVLEDKWMAELTPYGEAGYHKEG